MNQADPTGLVSRIADALERSAAADEERNALLKVDLEERRKYRAEDNARQQAMYEALQAPSWAPIVGNAPAPKP